MREDKAKKPAAEEVDQKNSTSRDEDKLVPLTDEHLEKVCGGHLWPVKDQHNHV